MRRRDFLKTMATVSGAALATSCNRITHGANGNSHRVLILAFDGIDPVSLVAADKVITTVDAVKKIQEWLG